MTLRSIVAPILHERIELTGCCGFSRRGACDGLVAGCHAPDPIDAHSAELFIRSGADAEEAMRMKPDS